MDALGFYRALALKNFIPQPNTCKGEYIAIEDNHVRAWAHGMALN